MNKIIFLTALVMLVCNTAFAGSAMDSVVNYQRAQRDGYDWQAERNRQLMSQIIENQEKAEQRARYDEFNRQIHRQYRYRTNY
jgi:hypothetical protein